jgi:hypothetical protein
VIEPPEKEISMASFLITPGVAIQNSKSDEHWLFLQWQITVALAPGQRAIISSLPDGNGPIIVDNGMYVNGGQFDGLFAGTLTDPKQNLGRAAEVAYRAVDPIDVTSQARHDNQWIIQLFDYGYTFAASRLYLVIR